MNGRWLTHRWYLPVMGCLLAFSLRMAALQSRSLWYDEAFAILYASLSPARMIRGTVTPAQGAGAADVHPLLYYFSLHGWMKAVGRSPLAARFLSVAFGMITVALLWRLGAWCFDRRTGLAVGLLAAVNPFHVAYAQETRMYALLGLAAVTAAWGLLRAMEAERIEGTTHGVKGQRQADNRRWSIARHIIRDGHWSWWGLYAVGAALTLYAHNLGAFVLLAFHLLVAGRRRWWRHLTALLLADLVALALFGPWLIGVLPGQVGFVRRGYWLTPPGANEIVRALMLPVLTFYEPAPTWLLGLGLFTGLLILTLLVLRASRGQARVRWFLLLCWAPIVGLFAISQWQPLYLERALLPSALFYLVAIGWLLARGRLPRGLRWGLVVLLVASAGGSLANHYAYVGFPRPPFQKAAAYLQAHVEPGDVIVHSNKLTYFPMRIYVPGLPARFVADPLGSAQDTLAGPTQEALGIFAAPTISEAVQGADKVWFAIFDREVAEMQGAPPSLSWLETHYREIDQIRFEDLRILVFEQREA
jgi:uncharacterized membrane protein